VTPTFYEDPCRFEDVLLISANVEAISLNFENAGYLVRPGHERRVALHHMEGGGS
jgi:hypothetical protein